jgi:hypothetical protein
VVAANDAWPDLLAYVLMRRARLVLDEVVVHDHERLWYHLHDHLTMPEGVAAGAREMLGCGLSMGAPHTLLLPLKFLCCAVEPGRQVFLPTLLVPTCAMRVEVDLESLQGCLPAACAFVPAAPAPPAATLSVEHATLGVLERNAALAQRSTTLMYRAVQDVDGLNYVVDRDGRTQRTSTVSVDLGELNLPVAALAWVLYPERVADLFAYSGGMRAATLLFGSVERMTADAASLGLVHPWLRGARCVPGNVYAYSFALDAWGEDPSGSANFGQLAKPVLRLDMDPGAEEGLKCKVWGVMHAWLRFGDGRVSRVFSS